MSIGGDGKSDPARVQKGLQDYWADLKIYPRGRAPVEHRQFGVPMSLAHVTKDWQTSDQITTHSFERRKISVGKVLVAGLGDNTHPALFDAFDMEQTHTVADLRRVRAFLPYGALTFPEYDAIVSESAWQCRLFFHPLFRSDAATGWRWRHLKAAARPEGYIKQLTYCFHSYFFQYFHWFIDCLPRYWLLERAGAIAGDLYFGNLPEGGFQQQSLDLIGVQGRRVHRLEQQILDIDQLLYPISRVSEPLFLRPRPAKGQHIKGGWDPLYLGWLYSRVLNGMRGKEIHPSSNRAAGLLRRARNGKPLKLFLNRENADHRKLVHAARIKTTMEAEGYICVEPGDLTFFEQVDLFNRADRIVGLHGAALTNILWCNPKRKPKILEIYVAGLEDPGYRMIAYGRNLEYRAVPARALAHPMGMGYADIEVDESALISAVRDLDR